MGAGSTGAGVGITTYRDAVLTDTPVSYWRLWDTGTTAVDARGVSNGTINGSPTTGVTSPISDTGAKAMTFNGSTTQNITIPHQAALAITGDMTIEAWLNMSSTAAINGILTKCQAAGNPNPFEYRVSSGTPTNQLVIDSGSSFTVLASPGNLTAATWQLVAVTITSGGTYGFYVNGALVGTTSNTATTRTDGGLQLMIAGRQDSSYGLSGSICEVAIYNTVLTATRLLAHYNAR
jgi:hypothetical protein